MAAGPVYQITLTGDIDGQRVQNVLHVREITPSTEEIKAADLIGGWFEKFGAAWASCLSAGWHLTSIYCRRVLPSPDIPFLALGVGDYALIGTRGDAVCPPQTAILLSLYTAEASRHGRGRIYMPGVAEADQDSGQIVEGLLTPLDALTALMDDDFDGQTSGSYHMCVYSRVEAEGFDVLVAVAQTNLATQRTRRAYPGVIES